MLAHDLKIITTFLLLAMLSVTLGCISCPKPSGLATSTPAAPLVSSKTPAPHLEQIPTAKIVNVEFEGNADNWLGITTTIRNTGNTTLTGDILVTVEGPMGSPLSQKLENGAIAQGLHLTAGKEMPYKNPAVFNVKEPGQYQVTIRVIDSNGNTLDTYYEDYMS